MKTDIKIRPMTLADLPQVCILHSRVLPTMTARVGIPYLRRIYGSVMDNNQLHKALVATAGSRVIGAIMVTGDLRRTQRILSKSFLSPQTLYFLVKAILSGQITLRDLIDRFLTERKIQSLFSAPSPYILTFFVDIPHQGQGTGTALFNNLRKQFPRQNKLFVDTELVNTNAIKWYKSHGFRPLKTIRNSLVLCRN